MGTVINGKHEKKKFIFILVYILTTYSEHTKQTLFIEYSIKIQ